MRVAIVHYWMVGRRGGEKVLEALCEMYPQADIFTHVVSGPMAERFAAHKITTTFIARLPRAERWYRHYLLLMPVALERLDLSGYDLVLSSESGPAKGVIPASGAVHVCYCHSPMRYIWNMFHEYQRGAGAFVRTLMLVASHYLRIWDESSAARVDHFVANSRNVARRIRKYYHREAAVIYPPVEVDSFAAVPPDEIGDYYLMAGELVAYKRPDLAVAAFAQSGRRLVVIGGGDMLRELRRTAPANVTLMGSQPFEVLQHHLARCRALVFPGEEDFGIVPVEAMASGRPVVAYASGGATETVVDGVTGVLFGEQSVAGLNAAIDRIERSSFDATVLTTHARAFATARFKRQMEAAVNAALASNGRAALQAASGRELVHLVA